MLWLSYCTSVGDPSQIACSPVLVLLMITVIRNSSALAGGVIPSSVPRIMTLSPLCLKFIVALSIVRDAAAASNNGMNANIPPINTPAIIPEITSLFIALK